MLTRIISKNKDVHTHRVLELILEMHVVGCIKLKIFLINLKLSQLNYTNKLINEVTHTTHVK